jgi:sn-glycerol 3-phosphate transport system substrate-binding protein
MTIGTSAALGSVYDILAGDPNLAARVDVRVGPMPGPDEGGVVVGGGALWMVDAASDVERAAAWDYLTWLNEPEQQATWHAGTGYIPIRQSAAERPEIQQLWADRPGFKVAFDQITGSGFELGGPVIGGYGEFRDAIQLALEDMIASGTSPADAVAAADDAATEAIADYNERNAG